MPCSFHTSKRRPSSGPPFQNGLAESNAARLRMNCSSGAGESRRRSGAEKKAGHQGGADQIAAHDFPVVMFENPKEPAATPLVRRDSLVA